MFKEYKEKYKNNKFFLDFINNVEKTFDSEVFKDKIYNVVAICLNEDDVNIINIEDYDINKIFYSIGIFFVINNHSFHIYINYDSDEQLYNVILPHNIECIYSSDWNKIKDFIYNDLKDLIFIPSDNYYIGDKDNIIIDGSGIKVTKNNISYNMRYKEIDCTWKIEELFSLIRHNSYDENGKII
jgi:hypothetical protein